MRGGLVRVVLVLLLLTLSASPASAATGTYLRLGHLSPEAAEVDITVTATANPGTPVRITNVDYGSLLDYRRVDPGTYAVVMRPSGADPNSAPLSSATLNAADGKAYTIADLAKSGKVLDDDISLPPAGLARLRVINAAPVAAELDVVRSGTAVVRHATYGSSTAYVALAAGTARMQVLPRGADPINLDATIEPGAVYTLLVVERSGKPAASLRADAKGAEVVPGGGQETGFGGMAPGGPGLDWRLLGLSCLLVFSGLFLFRRQLFRFG
ncbi:DUF4397 domain-containing protein [Lentzea tibetensis]|nr:DUF4397 domain-containing protein [Lentzea tibetensis]